MLRSFPEVDLVLVKSVLCSYQTPLFSFSSSNIYYRVVSVKIKKLDRHDYEAASDGQ